MDDARGFLVFENEEHHVRKKSILQAATEHPAGEKSKVSGSASTFKLPNIVDQKPSSSVGKNQSDVSARDKSIQS